MTIPIRKSALSSPGFLILLIIWMGAGRVAAEAEIEIISAGNEPIPAPLEVSDLPQIDAVVVRSTSHLARFSHQEFQEEFFRDAGTVPRIHSRSEYYHVATNKSFHAFVKWFHQAMWKFDVAYRPEVWDCDDFASSLTLFAEISAARQYRLKHGFAFGLLVVQPKHAWGGAPAMETGLHQIVLAHTDKGFFVIEPQTGYWVALKDYPNRSTILEVYLN